MAATGRHDSFVNQAEAITACNLHFHGYGTWHSPGYYDVNDIDYVLNRADGEKTFVSFCSRCAWSLLSRGIMDVRVVAGLDKDARPRR